MNKTNDISPDSKPATNAEKPYDGDRTVTVLCAALERLIESTYQAAVARGEESMAVRMARIHGTAVLAKVRETLHSPMRQS